MSAPLSESEIREAIERAERATSGPWVRWDGHTRVVAGTPTTNTPGHISGFQRVVADTEDDESDGVIDVINAEFIAHARTDVPRLAADLLAARAERDEAQGASILNANAVRLQKARAAAAEARCAALEAERAIVADYLRDTDADFRARRPSERAVLDALLSPPPPHACQLHRATSGASDCGLSPCEEAKVHRDRGASRPVETATPESAMERMCRENREAMAARYGPNWDCKTCGGSGRVVRDNGINPVHGEPVEIEEPCPDCHGCGGGA